MDKYVVCTILFRDIYGGARRENDERFFTVYSDNTYRASSWGENEYAHWMIDSNGVFNVRHRNETTFDYTPSFAEENKVIADIVTANLFLTQTVESDPISLHEKK